MNDTVERARGRWPDILAGLGVGGRFLRNKHGPCPICGGRDRYRFDDRDGSGSFYCNQCGAGNGVILLRRLHGWDFRTACDRIDEVLGRAHYTTAAPAAADGVERRRAEIDRVLAGATWPEIVHRYLARRGLTTVPAVLRGHPALPFFGDDNRPPGRFPAVVAPVLGPDGALQSCHRIYLGDDIPKGQRKKLMRAIDTVKGGAVRLFEAGDVLGVAEGIETAIAAHELFGIPVWAAISAGGVEAFVPPPGLKRLAILADNDASYAGQKAAYSLAHRLAVARDRSIATLEVHVPPKAGTDWLDVLCEERGA